MTEEERGEAEEKAPDQGEAAAAAAEIDEDDSPGAQPDAPEGAEAAEEDAPRTSEGSLVPAADLQGPVTSEQTPTFVSPAGPDPVEHDPDGRALLVFVNEVAGGRKLLAGVREHAAAASYIAVAAPQNQPSVGSLIDRDEIRDAARSRVEVTMSVLAEFGFDTVGEVMDPDPFLALDDSVRAHDPGVLLLSAMPESRYGLTRKDLSEWAKAGFEPDTEVIHVPVRVEEDSVRWDVTHTLVVATRTVAAPDLVKRLRDRAAERPHRYTFICPSSPEVERTDICRDLAQTMADLYRDDIDATGQPSSPDPFAAVQNAVANYRIDEILISTLAGEQSRWLEEDLIGRVREITDKPVEHVEAGRPAEEVAAAVASGSTEESAGVNA